MKTPDFRHYFTDYRALLPYSILGVGAGIAAAAVILPFDLLITWLGGLWLEDSQRFSTLSYGQRFLLPTLGAATLGMVFHFLQAEDREVGIVHVLSRMRSHYGQLPLRNMFTQLLAGAFALATGQSGGREGPGVHLGAAISSGLGHRLGLPDNSQRILIACGTAGAISIAFDTPLAGVIFAMEVIVAEYTVVGFTPVILAAVSANTINHIVGTGEPLFTVPVVEPSSLWELPFILLLGAAAGLAVASFVLLMKQTLRLAHLPIIARFTLAGAITGLMGIALPQVLGIGYDTLDQILSGQLAPLLLLSLMAAKIIATACSVGLGLPIGLIGPNLIIGACPGAGFGIIGAHFFPDLTSDPAFYAIIGMGACMAAVMNAPLAALLAVVELSDNISIILPALLAVVAATVTRSSLFRQQSAHQTILRHLQRDTSEDPTSQMLQATSVQTVMKRDFCRLPEQVDATQLGELRQQTATWIVVEREGNALYLLSGQEFQDLLQSTPPENTLSLDEVDLRRWSTGGIRAGATLQEALDTLQDRAVEAVVVMDFYRGEGRAVRGILTRDTIEHFYLNKL